MVTIIDTDYRITSLIPYGKIIIQHFRHRRGNHCRREPSREKLESGNLVSETFFFRRYNTIRDVYGCTPPLFRRPVVGVPTSPFS